MFERLIRQLYLQQSGKERSSPNDWVKPESIKYDAERGVLTIESLLLGVSICNVANTGSMDGLMDYGHNVILIDHFDIDRLSVGDIVAFQVYTNLVLHRIVKIGDDNQGRYYRTRGDNCIDDDPYILRDEHIKQLCIGIIY